MAELNPSEVTTEAQNPRSTARKDDDWFISIYFPEECENIAHQPEKSRPESSTRPPIPFLAKALLGSGRVAGYHQLYYLPHGAFYEVRSTEHFVAMNRPQWLDFSQFEINHYTCALSHGSSSVVDGRWEINIPPYITSTKPFVQRSFSSSVLYRPLLTNFVTQPPCKYIGIYVAESFREGGEGVRLLERVVDEEGTRVGQLFDALQHHAPELSHDWKSQIHTVRTYVRSRPLNEFRSIEPQYSSQLLEGITSTPTFMLLLDNAAMEDGDMSRVHYTRKHYVTSGDSQQHTNEQWARDVFSGRLDKSRFPIVKHNTK